MRALLLTGLLAAAAPALAMEDPRDPWQGFNRGVFAFNEFADKYVAKPVAQAWRAVLPEPVDRGVTNFFQNAGDVANAFNFALQGEGRTAAETGMRVLANTTLGAAGFFDVAARGGLQRRNTDFGITLGKWGAGSGPYLVLPFVGPSSGRDVFRYPVDWVVGPIAPPLTLMEHDPTRAAVEAVGIIDLRADLIPLEASIVGDKYVYLRDIYLQQRDFQVSGKLPKDDFLDDDYGGDYGDDAGVDAAPAP